MDRGPSMSDTVLPANDLSQIEPVLVEIQGEVSADEPATPTQEAREIEALGQTVQEVEDSIPGPTTLEAPSEDPEKDRRGSPRQSSKAVFAIAPYRPDQPLSQANFVVVRGRNVNRTGVGLLSVTPYLEPEIVVALGAPGLKPIYILASVTHCTEVGEHQGTKLYLIGCRFMQRLAI